MGMRLIDADALKALPILNGNYDKENANEHFILGIETAMDCVDQMPTIGGWISVKDRLPEQTNIYLTCNKSSFAHGIYFSTTLFIKDKGFWNSIWDKPVKTVTHWMPLPELPKEEI